LRQNRFPVFPGRLASLRRRCRHPAGVAAIALATLAIAACGGNDDSSGSAATYTVGGTLSGLAPGQSVTLADNNTDALTVVGNGTFTFKMPVTQNAAYAVTVTSQPAGQDCTVTGGSGTVSADVTSVDVACTNTLYTVGGTVTGLASNAVITLQDNGADTLTVEANGAFTFATSLAYDATYTVTLASQPTAQGQTCLVTNGFSVVTQNITTISVSCGPGNQYAYVVDDGANTVSQYLIGNGGALSALAISTVDTGSGPVAIAVDPSYGHAYVTNFNDGTVSQYSIPAGGVLTPLMSVAGTVPFFTGTVPTGTTGSATPAGPTAIVVDPKGKFVYVLNTTDTLNGTVGTLSQFAIGKQGELTPLSTPTVVTSRQPAATKPAAQPPVLSGQIAIDPQDRFLFVTSPVSKTVSQYVIGADGSLTALATPTLATGNRPIGLAVNPLGTLAYIANYNDNTLSQLSVGATGLSPLAAPTVTTLGINPAFVAIDPTGRYLYETDNNAGTTGTVSQYSIGTSGALTLMTVPDVSAGTSPQWITVDLTGQYVFVLNAIDNTVGQYVITSGATPGSLTPNMTATVGTGTTPTSMAVAYGQ